MPNPADASEQSMFLKLTSEIVSAYVAKNAVPQKDPPSLIVDVNTALFGLRKEAPRVAEPLQPVVPIKKTITPDYITSLEDGKPYRTLKRHLALRGLSPEAYRAKWNLRPDYPMVAPNYRAIRSEMAKTMRLGQGRRPKSVARKRK